MTAGPIAHEPSAKTGIKNVRGAIVMANAGPGTAKSDLVLKFKDALGLSEGDYFEYMLTRFTEPSEVIGPIDISLLREGRYVRREQGKLPQASAQSLQAAMHSRTASVRWWLIGFFLEFDGSPMLAARP